MVALRYTIMLLCIVVPIIYSFKVGISEKRTKLFILMTFLIMTLSLIMTIIPPIAGNFSDARRLSKVESFKNVEVLFKVNEINHKTREIIAIPEVAFHFSDNSEINKNQQIIKVNNNVDLNELEKGDIIVGMITYDKADDLFLMSENLSVNPLITYPFIEALKHRIKNLNLHVPLHWTSFIAYLVSLIFSIKFLRRGNYENDIIASSAIRIGLIFTILGTVTGMIWAKFNWGAYWNWDPRQTTILVIMLIYFAYFGLRNSIDSIEKKAKLSAVYSIISFISVPVLMFIIPRLLPSLHPGGDNDGTTGPVISTQADMVDSSLAFVFYLSIAAFILLYFWLLSLDSRSKILEKKLRESNV